MELGIRDRVAVVTGAGRGIGRQISQTLAEEGVRVAVNDLFQERADESAGEISRSGGKAIGVSADVTDLEAVNGMVRRVVEEFGSLDILVNNAGIPAVTTQDAVPATGGFFSGSGPEQWERTMGLITHGVLNCSRAVIEGMSERSRGGVMSISAEAGRGGEARRGLWAESSGGRVVHDV